MIRMLRKLIVYVLIGVSMEANDSDESMCSMA